MELIDLAALVRFTEWGSKARRVALRSAGLTATVASSIMAMPPKDLMCSVPDRDLTMPSISQNRGPLGSAASAPFSLAMALGSIADHFASGQAFKG